METPKPDIRVVEAAAGMQHSSPDPRAITPAQQISGSYARVQSASLNRPRASPARPIKSAGSRTKSRVSQNTPSVSLSMAMKLDSNITNFAYKPGKWRKQCVHTCTWNKQINKHVASV